MEINETAGERRVMGREEKKLVEALLRGDRAAFRKFYRKQEKRLENFVMGKVGDLRDAEEIVQDSWLAFLDSLPLYSFRSKLSTFLFAICRHEIADYYRKKYAKRAIKLVPLVDRVYVERLYASGKISRELNEVIEKVYGRIKPIYAKLLRWKYEEEVSVKEMAGKLGMSVKAVESKLFRARKAFQAVYVEVQGEEVG